MNIQPAFLHQCKRLSKGMAYIVFIAVLSACGGTDQDASSSSSSSSSSNSSSSSSSSGSSSSSSSGSSGTTQQHPGKVLYEEILPATGNSCASCHAFDGSGIAGRAGKVIDCGHNCASLSALESKISATMPSGNPGECLGECATQIADYIYHELQGNERVTLDCKDVEIQKASPMRRMNKLELGYVVDDVFGRGGEKLKAALPAELDLNNGFATVGSTLNTRSGWVEGYMNGIVAAVDDIVDNDGFKADCSLGGMRIAAAAEPDQCDTTRQCQLTYSDATDCADSKSTTSVCMCGDKACAPSGSSSSSSSSSSGSDAGSLACFETDIKHVGELLFRRTLTEGELNRLKDLRSGAPNAGDGNKTALVSLLTSANFLFTLPADKRDTPRDMTGSELADRLALTLWGSVPDKALLEAARAGQLKGAGIDREIDRMIDNVKFNRFADLFVDPWIGLGGYFQTGANVGKTDTQVSQLLADMRKETHAFIRHIVKNNLPVNEMFSANYSFLNARLANHYGVSASGLNNNDFVKVNLPRSTNRRGLMTHGSVLSKAFDGNKTSVVKRGVVPLEAFTCTAPEPPTDPVIEEQLNKQLNGDETEKEKIAFRAQSTSCAGCHAVIDPIGWVFTEFGPLGENVNLDPDGDTLTTGGNLYGQNFASTYDMVDILVDKGDFETCFSSKFLVHAIGRKVDRNTTEDRCGIDNAIEDAKIDGNVGARDLVKSLLTGKMSTFSGTILE